MSKLDKPVIFTATTETTLGELVDVVNSTVDHNDIVEFIVALEQSYEDWDITERLWGHFEAQLHELYNWQSEG